MADRIPIARAKELAARYAQDQVIICTWERATGVTHVVTFGKTTLDCEQAAQGGNRVKRALGWPEEACSAKPARVRRNEKRSEAGPRPVSAEEREVLRLVESFCALGGEGRWMRENLPTLYAASQAAVASRAQHLEPAGEHAPPPELTIFEAAALIPDVTLSRWACSPGSHWEPLRKAIRALRAAEGFDVDAADPDDYDNDGNLLSRKERR